MSIFALLLPHAFAGPAMQCPMDEVLGALAGVAEPPHAGVLSPPHGVGHPSRSAGRGGKPVYGTPYSHHANSENFTVNWLSGGSSEADAAWVAAELEVAWSAFVVDQGWQQPVSSDAYLMWVLLDDSLGGTTGYTTLYYSAEYPEGYPVIYLNPVYLAYRDFYSALVAHELMHALQYRLRAWNSSGDEPWYWEASAQWAIEPAIPDNDVYAEQSVYYSWYPEYTYSSMTDYHQYGMFVFNAWLEDVAFERGVMKDVWELSAERPGDEWDDILAENFATTAGELWAVFAADMGNGRLPESPLYERVTTAGRAEDGVAGSSVLLGTTYLVVEDDGILTLEVTGGDAVLSGPGGTSSPLSVQADEIVAVTGTSLWDTTWTMRWTEGDSAEGDGGVAGDSGDGGGGGDAGSGATADAGSDDEQEGCACAGSGPRRGVGGWPLLGALVPGLLLRRRLSGSA